MTDDARTLAPMAYEGPHITVDPYSARHVTPDRGIRNGRAYWRIRRAGVDITPPAHWSRGWRRATEEEIRDRMIDLIISAKAEARAPAAAVAKAPETVRTLLEAWLVSVIDHMPASKQKSARKYEQGARRLVAAAGDMRLDRITRASMKRIAGTLKTIEVRRAVETKYPRKGRAPSARAYSDQTVKQTMVALAMAWKWGAEVGIAPAAMPAMPRIKVTPVAVDRMPELDEIYRVVDHLHAKYPDAEGPHPVGAALEVQIACGCRISEATGLRNRDVIDITGEGDADPSRDTRQARIIFRDAKTGTRTVYLPRRAAEIIAFFWLPERPGAFLFRHTGGRHAGQVVGAYFDTTVHAALRAACAQLGIEQFCTHGIRDRFINDAIDLGGAPESLVAEMCGNSPRTIDSSYRKIRPEAIAQLGRRVDQQRHGNVRAIR